MNHPYAFTDALRRPLPDAMVAALRARFGDRFSTAQAVRDHHGRDESPFPAIPPDAVVYAHGTDEVAEVVRLCAAHKVPLIPFGVGSSLEGHLLAVQGGLTIDLSQMNKVLAVNPEDLTVTVQAGVTRKQLNEELKSTGLFFPIDPGADASIGGMSATRASGTNAVRYGTMRENVLGLTVVTAEGKVIRTATRAKKSSAGYDLTRLFIGSEGTLGVITEVTVKLYPVPEAVSAAVVNFPTMADAVNTVIQTIQLGVPVARSEFLCEHTIRAINAHSKTALREAPTLFFEFHGTESSVREQAELVQQLARDHGGQDFEWASRPEDRTRLWNARHNAYFACLQARPGSRAISTDTCVPISRLADSITGARRILDTAKFPTMLLGHVGDGNFHAVLLIDPNDAHEAEEAERLNDEIVRLAQSMDGTCTGEHGVGLHKIGFLEEEAGADAIDLMRRIKRALDPDNILNPGKIFRLE
ncbi:FAD-binding protein [Burkholderiaceae bacterium FT117]|uniref:FAD-binding oxidoreductase n=1 Tax=Zeimonas sediminis TaxID=2944268 RepID=UPI002342EE24|nr:FAD-linked oxidase C-terminal domain-containing protein [Zeimonas sediminis]MCM5570640.1 FAD-binding protein [Zeimonas sediminis]